MNEQVLLAHRRPRATAEATTPIEDRIIEQDAAAWVRWCEELEAKKESREDE